MSGSPGFIFHFRQGLADGAGEQRELLGGKGAGLAEMARLDLPVPAGFTVTTEACLKYFHGEPAFAEELRVLVLGGVRTLAGVTGKTFGSGPSPLLLSVRSGARASMPGMMDTVLNIGLNPTTIDALAVLSGDRRFALDCYRRLIQMYAGVVRGLETRGFEDALASARAVRGVERDIDLDENALSELVVTYSKLYADACGEPFPTDPDLQLWSTVEAVFRSWNNPRADSYRRLHGIPHDWGTAANVQSMVFGNLGHDSATGVAFTRDPARGDRRIVGEYLEQAQGEDVVAGIRTPHPIVATGNGLSLAERMPSIFIELTAILAKLELHYRDLQDVEFTVERGHLFLLQTRSGKRTGFAQVTVAVAMVEEGLIDRDTALMRVEPESLVQLLAPVFDIKAKAQALAEGRLLAEGLPAGPGAASGRVVFSPEKAIDMVHNKRERVILVRTETSPEDIEGMAVAEGIVTARGGTMSHAAVVARGMGKPCIVGAHALFVDYDKKQVRIGDRIVGLGDWLSIDGATGEVMAGAIALVPSEVAQVLIDRTRDGSDSPLYRAYATLMGWADQVRRLRVRTNADTPEDAWTARALGAEGIGLARTEHMFFHADRIRAIREMILAEDSGERAQALEKVVPFQREDFAGLFRVMKGLPVTIRLLDPPLHEFLPQDPALLAELARIKGVSPERVRERVDLLHEANPMLGHRGARLAITYPEIYDAQVRAIFAAAIEVSDEGIAVFPEIMLPLISTETEMKLLRERVIKIADSVLPQRTKQLEYAIGTMIELPRAALLAGRLAVDAEFFSFGTNDLTQMTFGYSRDDAERSFLRYYIDHRILPGNPFQSLDREGVGELVRLGTDRGRAVRPGLKVGVCGEHGGDPRSIAFFHEVGLDYVSCSPRRVPIARLAAAQAALGHSAGEAAGRA